MAAALLDTAKWAFGGTAALAAVVVALAWLLTKLLAHGDQ